MDLFETAKVITFDVGFTIIFPSEGVGTSYRRHLLTHGYELCEKRLESSFFESWIAYVEGADGLVYGTTEDEAVLAWDRLLQNMLGSFPEEQFCPNAISLAAKTIYDEYGTAKAWIIHEDWQKIFDICKERGLKVGLISNWDVRLGKLLDELGLSEIVDFQVISAEHGVEKPHRDIFEIAAEKGGCKVHEIVHVGDTFVDDVIGAVKAGAKAVWCNHRQQTVGETTRDSRIFEEFQESFVEIDDLSELSGYLSKSK